MNNDFEKTCNFAAVQIIGFSVGLTWLQPTNILLTGVLSAAILSLYGFFVSMLK